MKKLLFLFTFCLSMPLAAMQTTPRTSALRACVNAYLVATDDATPSEDRAKILTKLKNELAELEPLTQEERWFCVGGCFFADDSPETSHFFLELWHNVIDINYNMPTEPLFFYDVLDSQCHALRNPHSDIKYQQNLYALYTYICTAFKDSLNINIKDKGMTPFMFVCDQYIRFQKPHKGLDIFLEHFLQEFNTKIIDIETTNKQGQTVFDICTSTKTFQNAFMGWAEDNSLYYNQNISSNKKHLLTLLKKYFPDKLCFTKERLENLNNCHFRFVKNYGE